MAILGPDGKPLTLRGAQEQEQCDHGVTFDEEAAEGLDEYEVRKRWPRLHGNCPKGCGFVGIYYASAMHYIAGDW